MVNGFYVVFSYSLHTQSAFHYNQHSLMHPHVSASLFTVNMVQGHLDVQPGVGVIEPLNFWAVGDLPCPFSHSLCSG